MVLMFFSFFQKIGNIDFGRWLMARLCRNIVSFSGSEIVLRLIEHNNPVWGVPMPILLPGRCRVCIPFFHFFYKGLMAQIQGFEFSFPTQHFRVLSVSPLCLRQNRPYGMQLSVFPH
jgi:hypothetical protein